MRWLDLFSGIGGFALGLQRAGHETAAFCEIDPFCRKVLAKHWPGVPVYDDVRTLTAGRLAADGVIGALADAKHAGREGRWLSQVTAGRPADAVAPAGQIDGICGGFPCQDISTAGKGAGIEGARSGLWSEYARLVGELRPRYVFVENVAALLGRGLGRVLGDLAALGYDAEWHCIPASAVGAPHRRDRIWMLAYPSGAGRQQVARGAYGHEGPDERRAAEDDHQPASDGQGDRARHVADSYGEPLGWLAEPWRQRGQWQPESRLGRMVDGIPHRTHGVAE